VQSSQCFYERVEAKRNSFYQNNPVLRVEAKRNSLYQKNPVLSSASDGQRVQNKLCYDISAIFANIRREKTDGFLYQCYK
jgi:hypothetical protein